MALKACSHPPVGMAMVLVVTSPWLATGAIGSFPVSPSAAVASSCLLVGIRE